MKITIKTADWKSGDERKFLNEAALLVYEANPEFYNLVSPDKKDIIENISEQLLEEYSELGYAIISILDDTFGGISVYFPSSEIKQRQLISFRYLMEIKSRYADFIDRVKSFASGVEPIPQDHAIYWSRLGITKEYRRQGIANMMNTAMDYDAKRKGFSIIFSQLCRDNAPSMKMHLGRGFSRISDNDFFFVTMLKKLK